MASSSLFIGIWSPGWLYLQSTTIFFFSCQVWEIRSTCSHHLHRYGFLFQCYLPGITLLPCFPPHAVSDISTQHLQVFKSLLNFLKWHSSGLQHRTNNGKKYILFVNSNSRPHWNVRVAGLLLLCIWFEISVFKRFGLDNRSSCLDAGMWWIWLGPLPGLAAFSVSLETLSFFVWALDSSWSWLSLAGWFYLVLPPHSPSHILEFRPGPWVNGWGRYFPYFLPSKILFH